MSPDPLAPRAQRLLNIQTLVGKTGPLGVMLEKETAQWLLDELAASDTALREARKEKDHDEGLPETTGLEDSLEPAPRRDNETGSDKYIAGFLAGQTCAYCEMVNRGVRLAGQLDVSVDAVSELMALIERDGCIGRVVSREYGRAAIWDLPSPGCWPVD